MNKMYTLAFDTTANGVSVLLSKDGRTIDLFQEEMDFGQAEVLIPEIRNTLETENLQFKDWRSSAPDPALLPASVLPFPPPGLSDWLVQKPKSSAFRLSKPTRTVLTRKKQPELTPSLSKLNAKTFIISSLTKN